MKASRFFLVICFFLLIPLATAQPNSRVVQKQIEKIEQDLSHIPEPYPTPFPWTRGVSFHRHEKQFEPATVTINFAQESVADLIAISPATYTDKNNVVHAYGFPLRFFIEAIFADDSIALIIDHRNRDFHQIGVAPRLFEISITKPIKGIRFTATKHAENPIWGKPNFSMALNEIMVFSGEKNIALNANVEAPTHRPYGYVWSPSAVVDGCMWFPPVDRQIGEAATQFRIEAKELTLDFQFNEPTTIDEFRIWPLINRYFAPESGTGFPRGIKLEAIEENGDAKLIYQSPANFPRPGAEPFMRQIPPTTSKNFRFTLNNCLPDLFDKTLDKFVIEEIELLENGDIKSAGLIPKAKRIKEKQAPLNSPNLRRLTDGHTSEGRIVPLRRWVEQFQQRVQIEENLKMLKTAHKIAQQKEQLRLRIWATIAVASILILSLLIWVFRLLETRKWATVQDQIACDLHDHIGANLSSISHTNQLLKRTLCDPTESQKKLIETSIETAQTTAQETRQIIQLLEQRSKGESIVALLQKSAYQILSGHECSASWKNTKQINALNAASGWNLLLFFKEVLNNILKHARATRVEICTEKSGKEIRLQIRDNGIGIAPEKLPLHHLESRAQRLRGKMEIQTAPNQGTQITLIFKGDQ